MQSPILVGPDSAPMLEIVGPTLRMQLEQSCAKQSWSPATMRCILAATDEFSMMVDCKDLESKKPERADPAAANAKPQKVVAASDDTSCAGVGAHLWLLFAPDQLDESWEVQPGHREKMLKTFAEKRDAYVDLLADHCSEGEWSVARRTCIAKATTDRELERCD